jgi:peptidoglycan hydrolase-like protein with peptidoglycan-binding domain
MRTLRKGMSGEDVRYLQYVLGISADGSFGPATETAVKNKQKQTGLVADGSVGPATQKKWGLSDFIVHIFDKDQVWFAGTKYGSPSYPLRTLKQWAELEGADYVFNLAFFNMSGSGSDKYGVIKGRTLTYLKAKGYDVGYGGTSEKLTIDANNICAGYKVGIVNGKAKPVSSVGKRARNANGQLQDGRYFHVQSVTTATEQELVQYMLKNYAVDLLLIQDAGGSTGFYDSKKDVLLAGEREGANGRAVASVVCVKEKAITERPIVTVKVCPCCGQEIK